MQILYAICYNSILYWKKIHNKCHILLFCGKKYIIVGFLHRKVSYNTLMMELCVINNPQRTYAISPTMLV
jgi:hypothetical protein